MSQETNIQRNIYMKTTHTWKGHTNGMKEHTHGRIYTQKGHIYRRNIYTERHIQDRVYILMEKCT